MNLEEKTKSKAAGISIIAPRYAELRVAAELGKTGLFVAALRIATVLRIPGFLRLIRLYNPSVFILSKIQTKVSGTEWRRKAGRFYSQFIGKGELAFDVGANRGTRVEIFRKLGARVVAVEPQEHCIDVLRSRFKGHGVFFEQTALGRTEGQMEMMICDSQDGVSTLSTRFVQAVTESGRADTCKWDWNRTISVNVKTLDSLISKYGCPSFCKIDVEGFEYEVLMGLSQPIPALSIEFVPENPEPLMRCIERLNSLGFTRYNYSIGETVRLALRTWVSGQEIVDIVAAMPHGKVEGDVYAMCVKA